MTSPGKIIIRADANAQVGVGHVMRCLTLALAWKKAGRQVFFLMASPEPKIVTRLEEEGIGVVVCTSVPGSTGDVRETIALIRRQEASWIVLDGYVFDADYQREIQSVGCRVLCFDDLCQVEQYYADFILNQNIYADVSCYGARAGKAQLLLGLRYALLRPEFQSYCDWRRTIVPVAHRVLVTLGGGDHANISRQVIQALEKLQQAELEIRLLVGPANPHREDLEDLKKRTSLSLEICEVTTQMPELMAWADIAITAAGSTCWELAYMGLPALLLVLADNQRSIAGQLDREGVAINLGYVDKHLTRNLAEAFLKLQNTSKQREMLSERGRQLVDGQGSQRVMARLLEYENSVAPC